MALYAIGEALIDFVPNKPGAPDDDTRYTPAVGGAPLNVAAAYAKLGGTSYILSQVGADAFGERIAQVAQEAGIDTRHLRRSAEAKTALAFVTLHENGEREFAFYRDPSADMLYQAHYLDDISPQAGDILHFCSVSLTPCPMRDAHLAAIGRFRNAGALISFDVNLRLPLWKNPDDLRAAVQTFLPLADIVKISDDELPFISKNNDINDIIQGHVRHVVLTSGAQGAAWYDQSGQRGAQAGFTVRAVDATGAGDAFIGGLLKELPHLDIEDTHIARLLRHACAVGALTTQKRGAIAGMPDRAQLELFYKEQNA